MIFAYFEATGRVLPVIEEGTPSPTAEESREADRLETALLARDPRVELTDDDPPRVLWHQSGFSKDTHE